MNIKITPTPEQFDTYEAIRKAQLLCAAENALLRYFEVDVSSDLTHPEFESANGFSLAAAINPRSNHYLLDMMVEEFESRMAYYNGEISENACWDMAIEHITNPLESEENPLYKAEGEVSSFDTSDVNDSFVIYDRNYDRLKETVGAVINELGKRLDDGEYVVKIIYENRGEYLDSDDGTMTVVNGQVKYNY